MKKIVYILSLMMALLMVLPSHAQKGGNVIQRLIKELNLSKQEQNEIVQVFQWMDSESKSLRTSGATEQDVVKGAIETIMEADQKIENIIGKERHVRFVDILTESGGNKGGMQLYSIIKELDLSADEVVSVLEIFQGIEPKIQEIETAGYNDDEKIEKVIDVVLDADKEMEAVLGADKQMQLINQLSKGKKNNSGLKLYKTIKKLNLSSGDVGDILRTLNETKAEADAVLNNANLSEEEKQQQVIVLTLKGNENLKKRLGRYKYNKLIDFLDQNGNNKQVAVIKKINEIGLTSGEAFKVINIVRSTQKKVTTIHQNTTLSEEEKGNKVVETLRNADTKLTNLLGETKKQKIYETLNIQF